MPTNLYGPNDNFDLKTSHVLPAMIRKFHYAKKNNKKTVDLWGSGSPRREFLHVDDLGKAVIFALENELKNGLYNVGTGTDLSILDLSKIIAEVIGYEGNINWDKSKPDGTPKKLMDVTKLKKEGWNYSIDLKDGIKQTYKWYINNEKIIRTVKF